MKDKAIVELTTDIFYVNDDAKHNLEQLVSDRDMICHQYGAVGDRFVYDKEGDYFEGITTDRQCNLWADWYKVVG